MPESLIRIRFAERRGSTRFVQLPEGRIGIRARYLATLDRWVLSFLAQDGSVIWGPDLAAPGRDLFLGHKHDPRVPGGELFLYSPDGEAATLASADVDCLLLYRAL